jgi:hypothetical protein
MPKGRTSDRSVDPRRARCAGQCALLCPNDHVRFDYLDPRHQLDLARVRYHRSLWEDQRDLRYLSLARDPATSCLIRRCYAAPCRSA